MIGLTVLFIILLFIVVIWKLEKKLKMERLNFENLGFGEKPFWLFFFSVHIAQERFWKWLEFIHTSEFQIQQLQIFVGNCVFKTLKKMQKWNVFFLEILDKKVLRIRRSLNSFYLLPLWNFFLQCIALERIFSSCRLNVFYARGQKVGNGNVNLESRRVKITLYRYHIRNPWYLIDPWWCW